MQIKYFVLKYFIWHNSTTRIRSNINYLHFFRFESCNQMKSNKIILQCLLVNKAAFFFKRYVKFFESTILKNPYLNNLEISKEQQEIKKKNETVYGDVVTADPWVPMSRVQTLAGDAPQGGSLARKVTWEGQ